MITEPKPFFEQWTHRRLSEIQNQLIKYAMMQDSTLPSLHRKDVIMTSGIITMLIRSNNTDCLLDPSVNAEAITYLATTIGSGNHRMFIEFKDLRSELGRLYKSVCDVLTFE